MLTGARDQAMLISVAASPQFVSPVVALQTCQSFSPGSAQQLPMPAKLAKVQTPQQQQHNQPAALVMQPSMGKGAAAAAAPQAEGSPEDDVVDFG